MALISLAIVLSSVIAGAVSQYEQNRHGYYTPAPVAILMHKQALGQDGSFNYAFSAENGLQQGEKINPDGSRSGSYSYVDPNGKTISLKYTAGKDGFRVLQGDHVPRPPPVPVAAHPPANNYYQPQPQIHHGQYGPVGRPTDYRSPPAVAYGPPQYSVDEGNHERSYSEHQYRTPHAPAPRASFASEEEPYNGPHTFGNGYSFEFSG